MSKAPTVFATANVGGIALYAYLFFQVLQVIRQEERTCCDFQDGLAYLTTAFPVLVFFVLLDLVWIAVMANQHRKHRDSGAALLVGIVAITAWVAIYVGLRQVP
jgi:hypothetical protein